MPPPSLRSMEPGKVLIVEDEPLITFAVSEGLMERGYTVLTALSAAEAICLLETYPDIRTAFIDIEMPGSMNGLKLAAAVHDRWPPVNIIITTGKNRPEKEEMPTKSVFIPKPYLPEQVLNAVSSFG